MERPGPGPRIIQQPLRNWVFGEVFHRDMNKFLTVARNDYLYQSKEFTNFREEVRELVKDLNDELRRLAQETEKIHKSLIVPFAQFASPNGALKQTEQRLRRLMPSTLTDIEFQTAALENLNALRQPQIENRSSRVDLLLEKTKHPIILGEDSNALVRVDPAIKERIQESQLGWDTTHKRVIISLSPNLFEPRSVVFLGKTFEVYFVTHTPNDAAISFDVTGNAIYVNPFNQGLADYSLSLLDVYVALQVADAMSPDKEALKKNLLALLGPVKAEVAKYITPLGDDLRRTLRFAKAGA